MSEIEEMCAELERQTLEILNRNYPLDSREFLDEKDALQVKLNDEKINKLSKEYLNIYKNLLPNEQRNHVYRNVKGNYYKNSHEPKGLIMISVNSDEYELHEAFSKATSIGMDAIDKIISGNEEEKIRNQRILDECIKVLTVHPWGKQHIENLKRYSQEKEANKTDSTILEKRNNNILPN